MDWDEAFAQKLKQVSDIQYQQIYPPTNGGEILYNNGLFYRKQSFIEGATWCKPMLIDLIRALDDGTTESVRESLALLAEGEGPDPEVYRDIAKAALTRLDASLDKIKAQLEGK